MVVKGTAYEYYFRNAANDDLVKKKIWKERMEPYIDDPDYATVGISNIFNVILIQSSYPLYIKHFAKYDNYFSAKN